MPAWRALVLTEAILPLLSVEGGPITPPSKRD